MLKEIKVETNVFLNEHGIWSCIGDITGFIKEFNIETNLIFPVVIIHN
jgi:hypothetical protein